MLKILQAGVQHYMNWGLPDIQAGFKKGRGSNDQIAKIYWIIKKQESSRNIYNCFIDYAKAYDCVDHKKLKKFFKRWEYQITLCASWEICIQVKKQQLEQDMEQWTGSKSGNECVKTVHCHPAYWTYMQSTPCWAG